MTPLLPDLVGRLSSDIAPFCSVTGMAFGGADEAAGAWRNYFVGVVGGVAADEEDILWPNQACAVHACAMHACAMHIIVGLWVGCQG